MRRKSLAAIAVSVAIVAASGGNARALVGAGAEAWCTPSRNCITAWAASANAGSTIAGGAAAAVCQAGAPGALAVRVTCSVAGRSVTGGSVVVVTARADDVGPERVCWSVEATFVSVTGPLETVSTGGCATIVL